MKEHDEDIPDTVGGNLIEYTILLQIIYIMKKLFLTVVLYVTYFIVCAQEGDTTHWKRGGLTSLTFNQVDLTNWAAGGDNSTSLNGFVDLFVDYRKAKTSWKNSLTLGYGLIRQGEGEGSDWEKTDDKINLVTKFGYSINNKKKLFWSSMLDFRTQFQEGVNDQGDVISEFMAPGYLLISTGLDYQPNGFFSVSYSPITGKLTFVLDDTLANRGAFGVDPAERDESGSIITEGKNLRSELGSFIKISFNKEIMENVNYQTRLELFTNYVENFGYIDVNWENILVMKVNKYLSVNFINQLIYDDDIKIAKTETINGVEVTSSKPRVQYKNVFGVGITYNFGDKMKK